MGKFSLIDLEGASEVINNLIDKLSDAASWIVSLKTSKQIAVETYIDEIKASDYPAIEKAALISNAKKIIKEYTNQYNIVKIAIDNINQGAKPEEVDDDWIAQFMDKARLISDEQFQDIWGRILAAECNNPNRIPKSLMHILEQMDAQDAKAFLAICSVSIYVDDEQRTYSPIIKWSQIDDYYTMLDITYDSLVNLVALGLIELDFGIRDDAYSITYDCKPVVIHYFDNTYQLPDGMQTISEGNIIYTKAGEALCRVITTEEVDGFWEKYCLPSIKKDITNHR